MHSQMHSCADVLFELGTKMILVLRQRSCTLTRSLIINTFPGYNHLFKSLILRRMRPVSMLIFARQSVVMYVLMYLLKWMDTVAWSTSVKNITSGLPRKGDNLLPEEWTFPLRVDPFSQRAPHTDNKQEVTKVVSLIQNILIASRNHQNTSWITQIWQWSKSLLLA